jgi:hypothetical protein
VASRQFPVLFQGKNAAVDHDSAAAITLSQPPAAQGELRDNPRYRRPSPANRFF